MSRRMRLLILALALLVPLAGWAIWVRATESETGTSSTRGPSELGRCVERLPDDRASRLPLRRDEMLRGFASVRDLRRGDYTAFVSGPGRRGPAPFVDPNVPLSGSYLGAFVGWRQGATTVTARSHSATPAYVEGLLRCGGFEARARTARGMIWRLRSNPGRVVVARRGVLLAGLLRSDVALLLEVSDALGTRPPVNLPAGWDALRAATGSAAALAYDRRSCARFRVLDVVARRRAKLTVGLPAGRQLRPGDVDAPRGVILTELQQSENTATVRVEYPRDRSRPAERSALVFAGVPPFSAEPWSITCL